MNYTISVTEEEKNNLQRLLAIAQKVRWVNEDYTKQLIESREPPRDYDHHIMREFVMANSRVRLFQTDLELNSLLSFFTNFTWRVKEEKE